MNDERYRAAKIMARTWEDLPDDVREMLIWLTDAYRQKAFSLLDLRYALRDMSDRQIALEKYEKNLGG